MEMDEIIGRSKSERTIVLIIALIVLFGIIGIAVYVIFAKDVAHILGIIYGALGLSGGGAVARSIVVDKPIRQQEALIHTAQVAKQDNISIPVAPALTNDVGLQVWKPPEDQQVQ